MTCAALKLLPHVFVHPGELRYAEWADFDLEKAVWTIPQHKTKMRRVHSVPLSRHGFHTIASSLLNEMGKWNPDAVERQLAHADNNAVRLAYTRGEYWNERVTMIQDWSDYLDQLRDGATILTGSFESR